MSVISFPTHEERLQRDREKYYQDRVEFLPEPIRTQLLNDLLSYTDKLIIPTVMPVTVREGLTESQLADISAGFRAYTDEINARLDFLMREIISLRFDKAKCQVLHGEEG